MKGKATDFLLRSLKMIALPLGMFLILWILSSTIGVGSFGNALSLKTAFRTAVFMGLVAIGMSFNLLANRWDYSVGASLTLASIIGPNIARDLELSAVWAIVICAITGIVFCTIVGVIYVVMKIHPLIISMGFLLTYEGLTAIVYDGYGTNMIGNSIMNIAKFPYYFIPFAILFVFAYIIFAKTKYGYHLRAVSYGSNVAVNMGINEKKLSL